MKNEPITKRDMAKRIHRLSVQIFNLGVDLSFEFKNTWYAHANEMKQISFMMDTWAKAMKDEEEAEK